MEKDVLNVFFLSTKKELEGAMLLCKPPFLRRSGRKSHVYLHETSRKNEAVHGKSL